MRTNCNNCGAVLKSGRCEYCGTVWEEPVQIDVTCWGDRKPRLIEAQQQIVQMDKTHFMILNTITR
jgi:predicted amidophosphoribosyltransferase